MGGKGKGTLDIRKCPAGKISSGGAYSWYTGCELCSYGYMQPHTGLANCIKCHHVDEAHISIENNSLLKRGKCMIPTCDCEEYSVAIKKIDEDLI